MSTTTTIPAPPTDVRVPAWGTAGPWELDDDGATWVRIIGTEATRLANTPATVQLEALQTVYPDGTVTTGRVCFGGDLVGREFDDPSLALADLIRWAADALLDIR